MKTIILENCDNFTFEENSLINLVELSFNNCKIYNPNKRLFRLPNLEKCSLKWKMSCRSHDGDIYYANDDIKDLEYFNSIIDFNSIRKLKEFEGDFSQFLLLIKGNLNLKKAKLSSPLSHDPVKLFHCINIILRSRSIKNIKIY